MEIHIGTEIKRVLDQKGVSASWLAEQVKTGKRNVYTILTRSEISTAQLAQISAALDFDFFSLYSTRVPIRSKTSIVVELDGTQSTLNAWIEKLTAINRVI